MSTLTLWTRRDPFADFDALVRNLFDVPVQRTAASAAAFTPAADVIRDGSDAVVRLELPGLDVEKDVTVEVDRGRLVVRGERRDESATERDGHRRREVRYGGFRRGFALPSHVTADDVTARYDAGVLSVRVAGAYAEHRARSIPVVAAAAQELPAGAVAEPTGPRNSAADQGETPTA